MVDGTFEGIAEADAYVLVSAHHHDSGALRDRLRALGATAVDERGAGASYHLVVAHYDDEPMAFEAVAVLRAEGWSAVFRPGGGGHLAAWRRQTEAVRVGVRLAVCFPWSELDRSSVPVVVELDPMGAFGAGAHPATQLLLGQLEHRLAGGERVLDVGCGSGVLAVAAACLGAARVTAIDIDPVAVAATEANARRNGVAGAVEATGEDLFSLTGVYDVVVANIAAETLVTLAPGLQARTADEGWLGLSGISPAQVSAVAAAHDQMDVAAVATMGDWSAIVAQPSTGE